MGGHGDSTVAQAVRGVSGETGSSAKMRAGDLLMRVLLAGRRAMALVVITGVASVGLVSGAGAQVPATQVRGMVPVGTTHTVDAQPPVVVVPPGTTGVVLGPATAYVRGADGVVRRVR